MKVSICIPARDTVCTGFAYDLARLSMTIWSDLPAGSAVNLHCISGTLIASQRNRLAEMALQAGADVLLWLDSDMRVPPDLFRMLVAGDAPIVGCNYATRRLPPRPTALASVADERRLSSAGKTGREPAEALGFGAILTHADVFRRLPQPWFSTPWLPTARKTIGEDLFFCQRAIAHGFEVLVDHDASQRVRHVGVFEFGHEHVAAAPAEDDDAATGKRIEESEA